MVNLAICTVLCSMISIVMRLGRDHVFAEGRRREEDELLIGQLQHPGVVKPGRDDGGRELLLHVTENLCPDIR